MRTPKKPVADDAKIVMKNYHKDKAKKYGLEHIEPTQPKWFVSYPYMIAIMAVLQVLCTMYGRKFFLFFGFNASLGRLFLLPTILYMFQIIAECYGWQYGRQVVWCNFIVNLITTVVCFAFKFVPFSQFNHADLQSSYVALMDTMWFSALSNCIFIYLSDFVCSALMCWSRFHWNGRFLIIRVLILHLLSEAILLIDSFISLKFNGYPVGQILTMQMNNFMARTIMSLMLLPVAKYVIWIIQHKIEKVVVFDYKADFNPFKFGINPADSVQFNATGWDRIDVGKIDVKKLAQAYSDEFFEEQDKKMKAGLAEQHRKYRFDKDDDQPPQMVNKQSSNHDC